MTKDQQNPLTFEVEDQDVGERLDKVISMYQKDWSRVRVQDWIRTGKVLVNGEPRKGNYRLKKAEWIQVEVPPVEKLDIAAERIPLDIYFEDEDVLVINKPRGLVVHPGPGNLSGTMVNALLYHCEGQLSGIGGVARPGIVHRIDKDTSGLIMVAKNDYTHHSLGNQLKEHSVERKYIAIIHGQIKHDEGTINAPIGRDPNHRQRMAVVSRNGKQAVTHFHVRKRFLNYSMIECQLETGRTHQIRVHLKYIGHPLVGDPVYGIKNDDLPIMGQALHAQVLGFTHPRTGKQIRIEAELPQDMENLVSLMMN